MRATPFLLRDSCPLVNIMVIWFKFSHSHPFYLMIPRMLMFNLAISSFTMTNLPWFMDLTSQVPRQLLFFTALDFTFTTRHIHYWASFLLWYRLFIIYGTISLLFPSSILNMFWPGGLIFCDCIFLPFHIVRKVLKARVLEWFVIPSSREYYLVRMLSVLGGTA